MSGFPTTLVQKRGDTARWTVDDIRDADGVLVTSGNVRLMVKAQFADLNADAIIDVTAPITAGVAELVVPSSETVGLPNQIRWLSFDISIEGAQPQTLFSGTYIIEPEVATA